ncbi:MAG: TM2 domain-containing protein, partial [Propionibacteriaceae bacterium]|nr:TM2 domain-containing protein [Propionibacteriaceae bacterium]
SAYGVSYGASYGQSGMPPASYGALVPSVHPYAHPYVSSQVAPYGIDPTTGIPYSEKSKVVAGLLQIFLGTLGIGRFYLGDIGLGIAQILVTFLTFGLGAIWPLIDGIVLLAGTPRDRNGRPLRS